MSKNPWVWGQIQNRWRGVRSVKAGAPTRNGPLGTGSVGGFRVRGAGERAWKVGG